MEKLRKIEQFTDVGHVRRANEIDEEEAQLVVGRAKLGISQDIQHVAVQGALAHHLLFHLEEHVQLVLFDLLQNGYVQCGQRQKMNGFSSCKFGLFLL